MVACRLAVALQYLRQALELPSTPSAALHLNVSGVLAQLGKDSEAMYAARKAIAVADQPPTADQQVFPGLRAVARHNLATMLEKTDIDAAVKTAAEAVELASVTSSCTTSTGSASAAAAARNESPLLVLRMPANTR